MTESRAVSPLGRPVEAVIRPPGSKSLTIRSLACASLATGTSSIAFPLDSEDTLSARRCFRALGVEVRATSESWTVVGSGGVLRPPSDPLDAGASGLTARILLAIAPLVLGRVTVSGRDRLPERPMDGLLELLERQGVVVDARGALLPATVHGTGSLAGGDSVVSGAASSQFASAALLAAPMAQADTRLAIEDMAGSTGYLDLTAEVMRRYGASLSETDDGYTVAAGGYRSSTHSIEPDASAAVYPMVAAAITGGEVVIEGLGSNSRQPDYQIAEVLGEMGCRVDRTEYATTVSGPVGQLDPLDRDLSGCPDGALAVAVASLFASGTSRLHGLGSLRFKESDRLEAVAAEIDRVGGRASVEGSSLSVTPGSFRPTIVKTYWDHRMAMSFALIGLQVEGIALENPNVVNKTWPQFWGMLDDL